jgi:predicted anti-sigma-YlaC factor YlaD
MAAPEPCPNALEMTDFLEGRLEGEERDRMVRHLNRCQECFEYYVAAAELLDDLEASVEPPEGDG